MMKGTNQSTLEQAKAAFHAVCGGLAARIFALGVSNNLMAGEVRRNGLVRAEFVGINGGGLTDIGVHDRAQSSGGHARDMEAALFALAVHQRDNLHLVLVAVRAFLLLAFVAPKGFVHFDNAAARTKQTGTVAGHGFADAVGHEPCGLVSDAEHAVNLVRTDGLLASAHEMHSEQPLIQCDLGIREYGSDDHGELLAAVFALHQARTACFAVELVVIAQDAAMWAYRTVRPAQSLKVFAGFVSVLKLWGEKIG